MPKFRHIAIVCDDPRALAKWYQEAFDLQFIGEYGKNGVTVLSDGELGWWNAVTGEPLRTVRFSTPGFSPLILAVCANPDHTRFSFETGCQLRVKIVPSGAPTEKTEVKR